MYTLLKRDFLSDKLDRKHNMIHKYNDDYNYVYTFMSVPDGRSGDRLTKAS